MCLLRAYGGYPTLVCHLGLKDMQRFRPRFPKTLYVTAPVAGRSLGPQVIAISKKNKKSYSRCPPSIRESASMISWTAMTQVGRWECSTLYFKFLHRMVKGRTHNYAIVASYTRMTVNMYPTIRRIRFILSISLQRRNRSIPSNLLTIPEMMEFCFCRNCATFASDFQISCIAHMKEYSGIVAGRYHHSFIYFV